MPVTEVASFELARIHGRSNLRTFGDGWRVLHTIVREWVPKRRRARLLLDTRGVTTTGECL